MTDPTPIDAAEAALLRQAAAQADDHPPSEENTMTDTRHDVPADASATEYPEYPSALEDARLVFSLAVTCDPSLSDDELAALDRLAEWLDRHDPPHPTFGIELVTNDDGTTELRRTPLPPDPRSYRRRFEEARERSVLERLADLYFDRIDAVRADDPARLSPDADKAEMARAVAEWEKANGRASIDWEAVRAWRAQVALYHQKDLP